MVRFDKATLSNGKVEVGGPVDGDGKNIKHLVFMVGQGQTTVDAHAKNWLGGRWDGQAPADKLKKGPAYAVGVAVMLGKGATPSYETYTWSQAVTLKTA